MARIQRFKQRDADRTLPLLRRVVRDIVGIQSAISEVYARWRDLADRGVSSEAEQVAVRLRSLLADRDACLAEIEQIGCRLYDAGAGIVHFAAAPQEGVEVLEWRLGDSSVRPRRESLLAPRSREAALERIRVLRDADSLAWLP